METISVKVKQNIEKPICQTFQNLSVRDSGLVGQVNLGKYANNKHLIDKRVLLYT